MLWKKTLLLNTVNHWYISLGTHTFRAANKKMSYKARQLI